MAQLKYTPQRLLNPVCIVSHLKDLLFVCFVKMCTELAGSVYRCIDDKDGICLLTLFPRAGAYADASCGRSVAPWIGSSHPHHLCQDQSQRIFFDFMTEIKCVL